MKEIIQAAIDQAPTEESLGLAEAAKIRSRKRPAPRPHQSQYDRERTLEIWRKRKELDIAALFGQAKVEKITLTDGRTKYTVWDTKENLEAILKRLTPALKTKKSRP